MSNRAKALRETPSPEMTPDMVVVGKDVLELLSSAMYVDPMAIFREYVQNAADAIDEARAQKLLSNDTPGTVAIDIDPEARSVRIRDNGIGLTTTVAARRLLSVGASYKRNANLRGFRGVGRLAGLGYCRELAFRAKASGDHQETEVIWDCRGLKANLRDPRFTGDIVDLVRGVVQLRQSPARDVNEHYFEVELRGIVRHKNDALLDIAAISDYLAQVAPAPFSPEFVLGREITEALATWVQTGSLNIYVNGSDQPIYRPHRDEFPISESIQDRYTKPEFFELVGLDGNVAAVGWLLHHSYLGAIPTRALVRGLRARCGDIQVGGADIFEDCFQESRFNGWIVGELHIIDRRIVPNGRRDHFEQNAHFNNIHAQLVPIARNLVRTCRETSIVRNRIRDFQKREQIVMSVIESEHNHSESVTVAHHALFEMRRLSVSRSLGDPERQQMQARVIELSNAMAALPVGNASPTFNDLPPESAETFMEIVTEVSALIHDRDLAQAVLRRLLEVFRAKEKRSHL